MPLGRARCRIRRTRGRDDAGSLRPIKGRRSAPSGTAATTSGHQDAKPEIQPGPPILSFAFDFSLTVDDLAKLSPDQIAALYEAVGKVVAINKATVQV